MLGLLFVTFFIGRVMPVDPVLSIVGERASQEIYDAAYKSLGLDKPLIVQFFYYLRDVVQGDFGISLRTGFLVSGDIKRVFPATMELATLGTLIGVLIGVPLGVPLAALGVLFVLSLMVLLFFFRKRGLQHREALAVVSFYSVYVLVKLVEA